MTKFLALCAPLLVTGLIATGCDAPSIAAAATTPEGSLPSMGAEAPSGSATPPSATASSSPSEVGETCTSGNADKQCLAIHFVAYNDANGDPTASRAQAAKIISTMNRIWAQCNIGFQIENYEAVDPVAYGLAYGAQAQNELDTIRFRFNKPSNQLLAVTTGPWGTMVNAWTNMPGGDIYGAVMEASIVNYGGGIIYAHEFGHYLGLNHVGNTSNLMDAVIYTNSTSLSNGQCSIARSTVSNYWSSMLRN